jgi:hypothetical protein
MQAQGRKHNVPSCSALALMLLATSGCGDGRPARVPVSGQVLIDGQPLKFGVVDFVPEEGRSSSGVLDMSGRFTLSCFTEHDGAILGKHQIQVHAEEVINDTTARIHAPKKYGFLTTSGLSEEIKAPTDSIVISLTWKGNVPDKPYTENLGLDPSDYHSRPKSRPSAKSSNDNKKQGSGP